MIVLENLGKRYGAHWLFESLTMHIPKGSRFAVCGPSGCGKTTFLRLLCGLEEADAGRITIDGHPLSRKGSDRVACMFQEPRLFPACTAAENLLALRPRGLRASAAKSEAEALLTALGLADSLRKYPDELSGGMKQRVSLAAALFSKRPVLLLDEPFRGLDDRTRELVLSVLSAYLTTKTLVLVTHDPRDVKDLGCEMLPLFREDDKGLL